MNYATNPQAIPRFAVALDYFDMLGVVSPADKSIDAKHETRPVFVEFKSAVNDGAFRIVINRNLPDVPFVKSVALFAYSVGTWRSFEFEPIKPGTLPRTFMATPKDWMDDLSEILTDQKNPSVVFLVVTFNTELKDITGYTQYNYDEGAHGAKRVRRPPGSRRAVGFVGVRAIARA